MTDLIEWHVRKKGSTFARLSDRLVIQGRRRGVLDLSVCLLLTASTGARTEGLGLLGPLAAACTSEGIRRDTGVVSWFHWPDLVTIDGRVVAKASSSLAGPEMPGGVVLRVLVNCFAARPSSFPPDLPAASILDVLGVEIDVDLLRDKVLHALNWYFAEWQRGMHKKLVARMQPTIPWLGSDVEVATTGGQTLRGAAKGLDDRGSLLLLERGDEKMRTLSPETAALVRTVR